MLAKALEAGKANSYPEYVAIPVKVNLYFFQNGRTQNNQLAPNGFMDLLKGLCHLGDLALVSATSRLNIAQWQWLDQPW